MVTLLPSRANPQSEQGKTEEGVSLALGIDTQISEHKTHSLPPETGSPDLPKPLNLLLWGGRNPLYGSFKISAASPPPLSELSGVYRNSLYVSWLRSHEKHPDSGDTQLTCVSVGLGGTCSPVSPGSHLRLNTALSVCSQRGVCFAWILVTCVTVLSDHW